MPHPSFRNSFVYICVLLVIPLSLGYAQENQSAAGDIGTVTGTVYDAQTGNPVREASVEVVETKQAVQTDLDGKYVLKLPAGTYRLRVFKEGYFEQPIEDVEVSSRATAYIDPVLVGTSVISEKVVVTADTVQTASVKSVLLERQMAETIIDNVSAEDISKNPDGDAAGVLERVTGISVVQDKYVYVRGLGERYSNTMLNGAVLPSTEPEKKVVAFDLFPASLINKISTLKSYSPDQPADFSGALVKVDTVEFPAEFTLKYSASVGFNSNVTSKDYLDYLGSHLDWIGFGEDARALPEVIPNERVVKRNQLTNKGFGPEELQAFGRAFKNEWSPEDKKAAPNFSQSFMGGGTIGKLGTVFSLTYARKFQRTREVVNSFNVLGDDLIPYNLLNNDKNSESVKMGFVGNFSYKLTSDHKLLFKNFYTRDTSDEVRVLQGLSNANSADERDTRFRYVQESIFTTQASGEHYFVGDNDLFEWHLAYSTAERDEPDMREMIYRSEIGKDVYSWSPEGQSGFRQFSHQFDRIYEPALDWSHFFIKGGISATFKFGGLYHNRQRDFSSRRFIFLPLRRTVDFTLPPEKIFAPENLVPGNIELREITRSTDTYEAEHDIYAAYGMTDISLSQKWRFVGGARWEKSQQFLRTFDPFAPELTPVVTELDNADILPSASVVYLVQPNMNLRAGFSRTLNRPEFRELAPFQFTDISGRSTLSGNPDLQQTKVNNFDVRWEYFPSGIDLFAASFFWKRFEDPIERVLFWSADVLTSWFNVDRASNRGIELEVKKNLGFLSDRLENFNLFGNYSRITSSVQIGDIPGVILTSKERPLQGQAKYIFNSVLEYQNPQWQTNLRVLYKLVGPRITDVGANQLPDVFEQPTHFLDFSFAQRFKGWERVQLKVSGQNLLNRSITHLQGDQIFFQYKLGRVFSIGLSYDIY